MKKLLLVLALVLLPSFAWAQCTGVFPPNTLCGNLGGSPAPPAAFTASTTVGPGSSTVNDIAVWNNTTGTLLKDVPFVTICGSNIFSSSLVGCVPASGGGTANFLRADGTFTSIPAGTPITAFGTVCNPTSSSAVPIACHSAYLHSKDFGAVGNGSTDDTTNLQTWLTACQTNNIGCFLDAGTYKTSSVLNVTGTIAIVGAGPNTSILAPSNATQDTIDINTNAGFGVLFNFGIIPSVTKTAGASINITAPTVNLFWRIEGMQLGTNGAGDKTSINVLNAADIYINRNTISCNGQCINASGVNKALEDANITDNFIQPYAAGGVGINLTDVSGPKLVNNKILGLTGASGASGIFWNGDNLCTSCSDLFLANNSIEVGGYGILLESGGTSFSMANITITGNEFQGGAFGNPITLSGATYTNVAITGNVIAQQGAGGTGISLLGTATGVVVANNTMTTSGGIGINIASTITQSIVADNKILGATTVISNVSTSTVIKDTNGITVAFLPTSAGNGSQIFTTDGAPASGPCTGTSTGSTAFRQNGAWKCF